MGTADAATAPSRPTSPHVASSTSGTYVTWSGTAHRWNVQQATDSHFTSNVRNYVLRGPLRQFTPWGLAPGTTYYFRVRAVVGTQRSAYTAPMQVVARPHEQNVRLMTYNILKKDKDGSQESGNTIAPWLQRKPKQIALINQAHPDILTVQEAGSWVGPPRGDRQADDLVKSLGGTYGLSATEVPVDQPGFKRTGIYVLYKKSAYQPVTSGGHWDIGQLRFAVYQLLENTTTRARVLIVATHLLVGVGESADYTRKAETEKMISLAKGYAANHGNPPIVYAGDFNSHGGRKHVIDGPSVAMRAVKAADAFDWVQ